MNFKVPIDFRRVGHHQEHSSDAPVDGNGLPSFDHEGLGPQLLEHLISTTLKL
jgi:hypothetical protein